MPSLVTALAASASGALSCQRGRTAQGSTAKRGGHLGLPVDGRIEAGESQQGEQLLGAEPLTVSQGVGHFSTEGWPAIHSQLVLAQQGELEGLIPRQVSLGIPEIVVPALGHQCPAEGLGGVLLIPHGRERQREVQERQAGAGVIGLLRVLRTRRRVASGALPTRAST